MPTFRTLHTRTGLIAMAAAQTSGVPINLTHMAVGDGNGNDVLPDELQTGLVRERFRAAINRVYQAPDDPQRFTAELVIPASVGGFTMRELGVFDADGSLFAVGNLPATYKPQASEGAYADTVLRLDFMVTNADVVTLLIDPNVAVATQAWISNHVTACALLPGGTTGQVLRKTSNGCGDTEWADPTDANVTVDTIEEHQTLAAGQVAVTLAQTSTYGLALYVGGIRLRNDEWTPHPADGTQLTLASAYPAGTQLTAVQNEPAGSAPAPLVQALNLADVLDNDQARSNLDVFSRAEARQLAPAGMVSHFARASAPVGWLKANGAAVSCTAYADLFAAIGTMFGAGDGFNTFQLPDLRGEFVRGWDDGRGIDPGRAFGSFQADEFRSHTHDSRTVIRGTTGGFSSGSNDLTYGNPTRATGGNETRPRNRALLACIKY